MRRPRTRPFRRACSRFSRASNDTGELVWLVSAGRVRFIMIFLPDDRSTPPSLRRGRKPTFQILTILRFYPIGQCLGLAYELSRVTCPVGLALRVGESSMKVHDCATFSGTRVLSMDAFSRTMGARTVPENASIDNTRV